MFIWLHVSDYDTADIDCILGKDSQHLTHLLLHTGICDFKKKKRKETSWVFLRESGKRGL